MIQAGLRGDGDKRECLGERELFQLLVRRGSLQWRTRTGGKKIGKHRVVFPCRLTDFEYVLTKNVARDPKQLLGARHD